MPLREMPKRDVAKGSRAPWDVSQYKHELLGDWIFTRAELHIAITRALSRHFRLTGVWDGPAEAYGVAKEQALNRMKQVDPLEGASPASPLLRYTIYYLQR